MCVVALPERLGLVVDLADTTFVDCSGMRSLLRARRSSADRGSAVVLRRPSAAVRRVLDLTDVGRLFPVDG